MVDMAVAHLEDTRVDSITPRDDTCVAHFVPLVSFYTSGV